ncbi:hypothetical protein V5O48_017331 [Marasmius crinis-equi]|uniref:Ribonuclease H1 N-terminal domain-containing protein n=1 Tax=Marasmius crinis-equi TaxID=585013 RepID=A0ABR3EPA1_9AGAR
MVQLSQNDNGNANASRTTGAGAADVTQPVASSIQRSTPNATITFSTGDGPLGLTETRTSVEHVAGWTVTTITTLERTQSTPVSVANQATTTTAASTSASNTVVVDNAPANPAVVDSQATAVAGHTQANTDVSEDSDEYWDSDDDDDGAYHVPLPTSYQRPAHGGFNGRWYVVFAGREVGVFAGDWEEVVGPLVNRVPHARHQAYDTHDDAVYQYARAYQGRRRGWEVTVLNPTRDVVYDPTYTFGTGAMLGSVDITGLDIDVTRVSNVV